ncbi:MAG: pitrilysin family protein [Pseudomonadota bacterium]
MGIEITTLPNGLRVVTDHVAEIDSVAIGVWADVGTRHEDLTHNGVAHMVEHMLFKGTPTRDTLQIGEQVENVGGNMNAYTGRENTAYYIRLLKDDFAFALEILADMIQNSTFPEDEMDKERDVILQEIGMTFDTPDDIVFDWYQETAYPKQALGAPILGTADIISNMKQDTLFEYVKRFYTPDRLVVSAAGGVPHEDVVREAKRLFANLPQASNENYIPADYQGGEHRAEKPLEQSHIVLGFQGVRRDDPDYYAAVLLSTMLGGGMSSRLFQEVREKRGLVYSVYSSHTAFHDDGQMEIYAGTGPEKLPELIPVVCDEVQKMVQECVSAEELSRAKAQIKTSMLMSRESMLSRANRQAKYLINKNEALDIAALVDKVEAVSADSVCAMAGRMFASKPTLAAVGPLAELEPLDDIRKRLSA